MKKFDVNDYVKARLTDRGKYILSEHHKGMFALHEVIGDFVNYSVDENGYSTYQL